MIVAAPWEVALAVTSHDHWPAWPEAAQRALTMTEAAILDVLTEPRTTAAIARLLHREADTHLYRCLRRLRDEVKVVFQHRGKWVKR